MNIARQVALTLLLPGLALAPGHGAERTPPAPAALAAPAMAEVIVRFKPGADVLRRHALAGREQPAGVADVLAQRAGALGGRIGRKLEAGAAVSDRWQVVRAAGVDVATLTAQLAADPDVEFAEPNARMRALAAPDDPLYARASRTRGPDAGQWYLRAPTTTEVSGIDIEAAWARSLGSAGVVVAVLDTGVRGDHPDLAGRLLPGHDFVSDVATANDGDGRDADPTDPGDWVTSAESQAGPFRDCGASSSTWHGTGTTALIGAATGNGVGMAGAAPGVSVLPVRVLGKCGGTNIDIQAAMRWAGGLAVPGVTPNPHPAKVLNLSLGGTGACSAGYQAVVDELLAAGVVVVAAAGNSAGGVVGTPANCRGVVSVLALRHAGTKVGFSDLGPEITLAAPGGNCVTIGPNDPCVYPIVTATNSGTQAPAVDGYSDSYRATLGTSYASPLVAATAGLMLSVQPALTPATLTSALRGTARAFPNSGADNGSDPTPVAQCVASGSTAQLQCYCTTAVCGAGMLDAGAAVAAVSGPVASFTVSPAAPTVGTPLQLASSSIVSAGRVVSEYTWVLLDSGGVVAGFSSATNAATAALQPTAAGTLSVQLTVTDDSGATAQARQTIVVAPLPAPAAAPAPAGGGGGGALSPGWLLLLAVAVGALRRVPYSEGPRR